MPLKMLLRSIIAPVHYVKSLPFTEMTGDAEALADTTARIEAQIAENAMSKAEARRGRRTTNASRSTTSSSTRSATQARPVLSLDQPLPTPSTYHRPPF